MKFLCAVIFSFFVFASNVSASIVENKEELNFSICKSKCSDYSLGLKGGLFSSFIKNSFAKLESDTICSIFDYNKCDTLNFSHFQLVGAREHTSIPAIKIVMSAKIDDLELKESYSIKQEVYIYFDELGKAKLVSKNDLSVYLYLESLDRKYAKWQ